MLSLYIKYSMHVLNCDINYCARATKRLICINLLRQMTSALLLESVHLSRLRIPLLILLDEKLM